MGYILTDFWVNSIIVSLIATTSIVLSLAVLRTNIRSRTNQTVAIMFVSLVFWILFAHLGDSIVLRNYSLLFNRLVYVAVFCFYYSLVVLPFVFPKDSDIISKPIRVTLYLVFGFCALLSVATNKLLADVKVYDWGVSNVDGSWIFILYIATILSPLPLIRFFWVYRKADHLGKAQIKNFFLGLFLFIFSILFIYIGVRSLSGTDEYYRYGNYSAIFLIGFTAYAILKHHLFNIRVILTELALVIINIINIVQIFSSHSLSEGLLRLVFTGIVLYGSYLLLESVKREIKFREELQQLSEELAHANSHLKELDQMKTEFVSLASHELLTPVSAIEGYLSMLLDEHMAKVEDPKAQKYLNNVYLSAKRLARLVADMLNISRIEEGRLLVEKKDVSLTDLTNQVIGEVKFKAEEKQQHIEFKTPENWQTYVDPDKIKEVIINLIGNSVKYSKNPGTISIEVEKVPTEWVKEKWQKVEDDIRHRPLDDQEAINSAVDPHFRDFVGPQQIVVIVKDQGIGIPKEELPRLFKKFHRVGDYSTAESQGTGLGLYISRALVELHHGRIWADSEGSGKGSTFTFSLPDISAKAALLDLESKADIKKEQLKPLARPVKQAEDM